MYPLKQSTALDVLIFAHDANGDGVTGIADGSWTKRISKNGGTFAAMTVTITERENGWYQVPLSTAHTDTLGILTCSFSAAGVKRVNTQFRVHARVPDDLAFPATSGQSLSVNGAGQVVASSVATGGITAGSFAAGAIDSAAIATDAIGSSELATTAATEIAGAVWEELRASHNTAGTFGQGVASVQGNVTGSTGSIAAGGVTAATFAAGAIDAAAIAADAIGGSEIAASAATEIAGAVWEELRSAHTTAGSFGQGVASVQGNVTGSAASIGTGGITAGSFAAGAIDASAIATDAIGSAEIAISAAQEIAGAVWEELRASHTTAGSFGQGVASVQGNVTGSVGSVTAAVTATVGSGGITAASFAAGAIDAAAIATDAIASAELATTAVTEIADAVWNTARAGHATAGTFGEGVLVQALNTTAKADVNAEVVDALSVDTYAEPGAVPGTTASLKDKINWLFLLSRNKITQTATLQVVRNAGDTANVATASVSDDGTTAIHAAWV